MSEINSVHNMFSQGLSLEFSCIELVVDPNIRASDKDLPVHISWHACDVGKLLKNMTRH